MQKPLRLLHLLGAPKAGGAETFFIRLMEALAKRDDVELLPIVRAGGWASKRLTELGIHHHTAWFGGWWDVWSSFKIRHLAIGFEPHAITGWMNRGVKHMPQGPWATVGRMGGYYKLKNYFKKVKYLIGNTEDIKSYCIQNGWPPEAVSVLGNFIPAPKEGWQTARAATRQAWGIATTETVLLIAGRLHTNKGVDTALHALKSLPESTILLLVGNGPEESNLHKLAETLGVSHRIRWAGWQDSISPMAAAADIWLMPSRHEPLGNSVLDAWAHSLPIIATNTPGPASLIGQGGKTGLLVEKDNPQALATAIQTLLNNPKLAKTLAQAGNAAYHKNHSEQVVADAFLQYYRSLAETNNA